MSYEKLLTQQERQRILKALDAVYEGRYLRQRISASRRQRRTDKAVVVYVAVVLCLAAVVASGAANYFIARWFA